MCSPFILKQDVVAATADVVAAAPPHAADQGAGYLHSAWVGYLLPFLALAGLAFLPWNRGEGAREAMRSSGPSAMSSAP